MKASRLRARSSSPADRWPINHDARWRPRTRARKVCGYTFHAKTCSKFGAHYCEPRADRAVGFFPAVLVHTKGLWAGKAFGLEYWQEHEIIRPLFGEVIFEPSLGTYVRRFRLAYIIVARKNGKSELAAAIVLYLLVGDDEEGAEVYGAAKDTKQAGKVADVIDQMRIRSPLLNGDAGHRGRLRFNKNSRRVYDARTSSYFEVITADALGELGHNPHGWYIDEVLSQPDASLFHALRTATGARHQPLGMVISTETNDPSGFGASEIDEAEKIQEEPARAPHIFSYCRKHPRTLAELARLRKLFKGHPRLPENLDAFDETNWWWPNPALGTFKRIASMREEAIEAKNEPSKENSFRQYQLNQRQQSVTRWMSLLVWDDAGDGRAWGSIDEAELAGKRCFGGLDLAATTDLASLCWRFPKRFLGPDAKANRLVWRFWVPEERVAFFDAHTGGQFSVWVREGWVRVTEGDWIDFEQIRIALDQDLRAFAPIEVGYDPWAAPDTVQWMQARGLAVHPVRQTYEGLSAAMNELMRRVVAHEDDHGANPVARWMADAVEVRHPADQPDVIRPVKPDREKTGKRIDGIVADAIALATELRESVVVAAPFAASGVGNGTDAGLFRPSERLKL